MAAAPAARALQNHIEERSFSFFAKSRDATGHKATPLLFQAQKVSLSTVSHIANASAT